MIKAIPPAEIQDALRHPARHGLTCCAACDAEPVAGAGLFLVSEQLARCLGQPAIRFRIFAFCAPCIRDQERAVAQVEEQILRAAAVRRARRQ